MRCSGGLTRSVLIRHRTPSPTKQKQCPVQGPVLLNLPPIPPLTSRVAFCVSPICPTSRSIASADTKQPCGAKPAKSCSRSMHWIVVSHRREGAVSVSVAGKTYRQMDTTTIDLPDPLIDSIDPGERSRSAQIWVCFVKPSSRDTCVPSRRGRPGRCRSGPQKIPVCSCGGVRNGMHFRFGAPRGRRETLAPADASALARVGEA